MTKATQIRDSSTTLNLKTTSILLIRSLDSISGRLVIAVINSRARQTGMHTINGGIVINHLTLLEV
jgi:hypothetical protein